MILPDVNVLVHAFRPDSNDHRLCRDWLDGVVNGDRRFGLSPLVLASVVRVTTHPRVFVQPSGREEVLRYCDLLLSQPHTVLIRPGERHWEIFTRLCESAEVTGNLVTDAWLAALAIESGCEWITLDQDFGRFEGLAWRGPTAD